MSDLGGSVECVSARYMEGFACIGGACEDDCCHGWRIEVDQGSYKRLRKAMAGTGAERERFRGALRRKRSSTDPERSFATLSMGRDGRCTFLEGDGRCEVHRRFGEMHLGQVCRTYPRKISRLGSRLQLAGDISCPEVARRCLLRPGALDLLPQDPRPLLEKGLLRTLAADPDAADPYQRYSETVREVMLQLLAASQYPLSSRLFFTAYFAHRIAPFYRPQSGEFSEERLAGEIERLGNPQALSLMDRQFGEISPPIDQPMFLIKTLLSVRQSKNIPAFAELVSAAWDLYGLQDGENGPEGEKWQGVATAFLGRREALAATCGERLEQILENYCRNFWLTEPLSNASGVLAHVQNLFIRLAALRFLLLSRADLDPLISGPKGDASAPLEAATVEVFYRFSRGIEHNPAILEVVQKALERRGWTDFAHLALLLKF